MTGDLEKSALEFRKQILEIVYRCGAGHITSAFSAIDIMNALFFGNILKYDVKDPTWEDRDRFILSKGHASVGFYAILAKAGFISEDDLFTYCAKGSHIGGHPTTQISGVEWYTGSLGHGLGVAAGIALASKMKDRAVLTYCLTGDGELQEGSNWEAALFIRQHKLNNLIWIIDNNAMQIGGFTSSIVHIEPLYDKIRSFGFEVKVINGHNYDELLGALSVDRNYLPPTPLAIICNTKKGGGGGELIDNALNWHGRNPNSDEYSQIKSYLNGVIA